jgi:D-3-phosphoglycerate dehydrogenase
MKVLLVSGRWASNFEKSENFGTLRRLTEIKTIDTIDQQVIKQNARDVDILITGGTLISAEVINSAEKLKMIQVTSVGYDHVDEAAAIANGVVICNVAEANANSVVELCFGMILDLARRISAHDRLMRAGGWSRVEMEKQIEIRHKTLGIVGFGAIGSRMAQIGNAFEMRILAYDPYIIGERADQLGARLVDLPTLLKESDVITIHVPLNEETQHIIGEKEFALMKPTAIFINASRGPVVDEQALIKVLRENRIGGAGLDVFEKEPLPEDSPLRKLENAVIVPHIGSSSEALTHMTDVAIANVILVAEGKEPMRIKTPEVYYSSPRWKRE